MNLSSRNVQRLANFDPKRGIGEGEKGDLPANNRQPLLNVVVVKIDYLPGRQRLLLLFPEVDKLTGDSAVDFHDTGDLALPNAEFQLAGMQARHVVGGIYQLMDVCSFSARAVSVPWLAGPGREMARACSIRSSTSADRTCATSSPSSG